MSLPAETKFLCRLEVDHSVSFDFDVTSGVADEELEESLVCVEVDSGEWGLSSSYLNRSQVESLRDQLTAWLNATKD